MTKLLVIGTGPLFGPNVTFFSGQAHRTWHFARVLVDAGHDVDLVVLQVEGDAHRDPSQPFLVPAERDGIPYLHVNAATPWDIREALTSHLRTHPPDAIVAVNVNAAYYAVQLPTWAPIWADLYGHLMGEAQAKCLRDGDDRLLLHFWNRQRTILRRADRFSCVSHRQKYATLGELGALGRLNRFTSSYRFADVIPSAASEEYLALPLGRYSRKFRGTLFPEDVFAVLWSGGFNTWTDPAGFAAALSLAMEQEQTIYLIVTGGAIRGHDEKTFEVFREKMKQAGCEDRCRYLGWIEGGQLLDLYRDCDLGVCYDALVYESVFGARTRLTNMMAAGLPVLTTICTEITEIIAAEQLGYAVPVGDVHGYAAELLRACRNPEERRQYARRAREFVRKHFSYQATAQPLLEWAENPALAPDNAEKQHRFPEHESPRLVALNPVEEEAMLVELNDIRELTRQALNYQCIQKKLPYRIWKGIRRLFFGA